MATTMTDAELAKINAEIANLIATTSRINSETVKLKLETFLYPFVVGTGVAVTIITLTKLFLN